MEETISLKEIFATIKKRVWIIVLITAIATGMSGIISYFFMTPIYQSSTQLVLQSESEKNQLDINSIRTNQQLVNTYSGIIKSRAILEIVVDRLNLDKSTDELSKQLSVSSEQNSQLLNIAVTSHDPAKAVQITNAIAQVFQKEIVNIMNVDNVSILSPAELGENPQPVKPNPLLNMAIAFVVGLMIGVGLTFLLEYLDNTIKSEQDIEKLLELPVLGAITEIDVKEQEHYRSQPVSQQVGSESVGS